jgi:hypothetical protein
MTTQQSKRSSKPLLGTLLRNTLAGSNQSRIDLARYMGNPQCQSQSNKGPNTRGKWGPLRLLFCGALAGVLVI